MKLTQVTLAVPDDIYADVMNGTLEIAGLVKDNNHIIRKHLPRVADKVQKNEVAKKVKKANLLKVVKNNKGVAIGVGIAAAVGTGTLYVIHSIREKKSERLEKSVSDFQKALKDYLKATKNGKLNAKVVDALLDVLTELQKNNGGDCVMLIIPASQLNELINSIFDYTQRLIEANAIDMQVKSPEYGNGNSIANLQSYLKIQKQIMEKAA